MAERPDGPELSNPRSDRIRALRALTGRSVRGRAGRFLVEGPQAVREAVRARVADEVLLTEAAHEAHPEILRMARVASARIQVATREVIATISDSAQGVIATAPLFEHDLDSVLAAEPKLLVVCHENQDPGNAGTIIRTADAAGADAVIFTRGSVDVFNPKVVRASVGSLFHVPVVTGVDLDLAVSKIGNALQLLAADGEGDLNLDELQNHAAQAGAGGAILAKPTAWLFGNEARGFERVDLRVADGVVAVPIHGRAESLNLATAAALCLYASARAQRTARGR